MNNNTFKVDQNGIIKEYQIIKLLMPKNSDKKYIIYTDDSKEYYASRYELVDNEIILKTIEEEYEWDYIDDRLKEIINNG